MNNKSWMMLRVMINRYHPQESEEFLKFLEPQESKMLQSQQVTATDLSPILESQKMIERFHYSWIKPVINKHPDLQSTLVSALTDEQIAGLKPLSFFPLSRPVKTFMLKRLADLLKIDEHIALDYLPQTNLSLLGKWKKRQIVQLIDFLGLYDLASEVRRIVNRQHLRSIYACLTAQQLRYLKVCLHQREQLTSPKLEIDPFKLDCAVLKKVLHRRGLKRLGQALCGQPPDLVWWMAHILDQGRGVLLLKEYQLQALPKVTAILKQQVIHLINFLKNE